MNDRRDVERGVRTREELLRFLERSTAALRLGVVGGGAVRLGAGKVVKRDAVCLHVVIGGEFVRRRRFASGVFEELALGREDNDDHRLDAFRRRELGLDGVFVERVGDLFEEARAPVDVSVRNVVNEEVTLRRDRFETGAELGAETLG